MEDSEEERIPNPCTADRERSSPLGIRDTGWIDRSYQRGILCPGEGVQSAGWTVCGGGFANMKKSGNQYIPSIFFLPYYGDAPEDYEAIKRGIEMWWNEENKCLE